MGVRRLPGWHSGSTLNLADAVEEVRFVSHDGDKRRPWHAGHEVVGTQGPRPEARGLRLSLELCAVSLTSLWPVAALQAPTGALLMAVSCRGLPLPACPATPPTLAAPQHGPRGDLAAEAYEAVDGHCSCGRVQVARGEPLSLDAGAGGGK